MADLKWFADHLPADGTAQIVDLTSAWCTLGLWGPRARDILASITRDDMSHEGFPFGDVQDDRGRAAAGAGLADLVRRRTRLGAVRADRAGRARCGTRAGGRRSRTASSRPGSACTARPGGSRSATARTASSSTASYNVVEAGMAGAKRQGRRTSSARRRTCASARRARGGAVHADRRRPHVRERASSATCSDASRS